MSEHCILAVTWIARPGNEERIAEILRTVVEKSHLEPGCLSFEANRSVDDPFRFFLYEVYRDAAALEAHNQSEHFQRHVIGEAIPLLRSRERQLYRPLED